MSIAALIKRFAPFLFVLLWSTGFLAARLGLPHAEPLSFLALRYALVVALMGALALGSRAAWPHDARKAAHIGVTGLLVHGLYLGGVFVAIGRGLPAGVTALVTGMQPLFTALGAAWLLHEKVARRQWLGLALGLAGVALVVSGKVSNDFSMHALLPAFVSLAAITIGTLYQKRFCPAFELKTGAVLQFLPCAVLTSGAALVTEDLRIEFAPAFLFALAWLVVALSIGAISLLNFLIRSGSAVNVASLFYLTPPTTAFIAWLMFDERLSGAALAGMALAGFGVWLAGRSVKPAIERQENK